MNGVEGITAITSGKLRETSKSSRTGSRKIEKLSPLRAQAVMPATPEFEAPI